MEKPDIRKKLFKLAKSHEFILIIVAILGLSGTLEGLVGHFPLSYMENRAVLYLDNSNEKAISTFVILRIFNSVISELESGDVKISLPLLNAEIHPFKTLQPIEELVEQLSDVMLISITSISAQRLLIQVSRALALTIILPLGCVFFIIGSYFHQISISFGRSLTLGRFMIFLAIFLRFAIPVSGWAGDLLTEHFLTKNYGDSFTALREIAKSAENNDYQEKNSEEGSYSSQNNNKIDSKNIKNDSKDNKKQENSGFYYYITEKYSGIVQVYSDIQQEAKYYYNLTASVAPNLPNSAKYLIALFQIFILQTLVFPIIILFIFYIILKKITNQNFQITTDSIASLPGLRALLELKQQQSVKTQEE
ncbi:MAG: hypothetical protein ACP5M5_01235 [Acidibrevibacterium sp.]|uniref:hypothetical protein n=1 Tax=Acidibrevibacterium sp. TaxID=2606776 RepID=UPI003D041241